MVYPKSVRIITFPKIDDKRKEFRGVIINKMIRNADILMHKHTFWVVLAYSIMIDELDIYKIY